MSSHEDRVCKPKEFSWGGKMPIQVMIQQEYEQKGLRLHPSLVPIN